MAVAKRAIPRVLGQLILAAAPVSNAVSDMMRDAEDVVPDFFPANLPDPQVQLVNMIALLFAGSLSILVWGYVFEDTNFVTREPSHPAPPRTLRRR
jgi:hypothetical protein